MTESLSRHKQLWLSNLKQTPIMNIYFQFQISLNTSDTVTSLTFNKHWLIQVHLENGH